MKLRPLFILLAALTLSATVRSAPGTLIPRPQEATRLDGQFVFTTGIPVVYASGLEPLAEYIADYIPLQRLDDRTWTAGAALRLSLDGTMDDESYRLTVTPQGVQVVGADYGGVFNGLQTLLQLLPPEVYTGQATLPLAVDACRIEDAPRFHYRGMMLDVVRTWMDADRVKRHIDLLSHLKINKLHLLLSNDEGWRLEIKSHPELTEIGAWRGGDSPVMPVYGKWDEKYGGFYTQEQAAGAQPQLRSRASRDSLRLYPRPASDGRLRLPLGVVRFARGELSAAGRYSGRAGGALPVGVPPYRRRRGRHEPMGEVSELSGTHGARGNGRRTCAGTVLSGKVDPHSRSQRQASRRVERGDRGRGAGPQHPCPRLGERQGLPRCHGGGLPYGGDARPVFLFRHAPVAP